MKKHVHDSAKRLAFLRPCLLALGLFTLLLLLTAVWTQPVAAAEGDALTVLVDGRAVTVEGVEAQVDGVTASYTEVLKVIGPDAITADSVEVFAPPDTPITVADVKAIVQGREIKITNLTQPLAARGRIGIWINGSNWRLCIIIVWGSNANLNVSVDGREVTVEGVEAQLEGRPATLPEVVAFLGPDAVTADQIELFDPASPDVTRVVTEGVQAVMHGNALHLSGLAREVALRGRIGIWVSGKGWRVCVIIVWGSRANLNVSVDGREVTVEGVEAEIEGKPTELRRVLALLGTTPVTADKIELFDPADPTNTKVLTEGVQALIKESHLALTGLSPQLARGRIGIWVSGSNWRICIIIVWGSKANLDVSVDGRTATVEGVEAEIDGQPTELRRVLTFLGDGAVKADKVEVFDPATPSNTQVLSDVVATVEGSHLSFTDLAPELAARGRIGIWISGSRWRICIIIVWGSSANLDVTVDGRDVTVTGIDAEIEGQRTELRRVLTYLGSTAVTADKVELFDPATPNNTKVLTEGVQAVLAGNQLMLTGLAPELAARGRIGIWISGSRWRICIIIVWGSQANLEVSVDGRAVAVKGVEAEFEGQPTDLRRVLALLGPDPVVAEKVELFKPAALNTAAVLTDPVTITPTQKVTATIVGNQLRFTGLANTLARHKTIGIWISGSKWRICIIIILGSDNSPRVLVDGRPVIAYQPEAELDGQPVDPRRVLSLLSKQEVTAEQIEIEANGQPVTDSDAKAVIKDGRILLTNLSDTLAARGRISIWISGSRWRICIIIEWGRFASADGQVKVDLPATDAHAGVNLLYTAVQTPTHPLPLGKRSLRAFLLDAENSLGAEIDQLDGNYTLEVNYTDADLTKQGIVEGTLKLYVFDEATGQWVLVPTTVDAANNKAMGTLDHFTEFALLGDPIAQPTQRSLFLPLIQK